MSTHQVSLKAHDGQHYLCAELDGRVVANRQEDGPWERWTVEAMHGGQVALKSAHGRYLCAELDGTVVADREKAGIWETWAVVPTPGGVGLRSHHGGFLVAEDGGGGAVLANRHYETPGPWETFTPSGKLGDTVTPPPVPLPSGPLSRLRVEDNKRWFRNDAGRFDFREVSGFSLLSRVLTGEVDYVRTWLRTMRAERCTVVRVICTLDGDYWTGGNPIGRSFRCAPDIPGYWEALDTLVTIAGEEGLYLRLVFIGAVEPFGGVWHPDRRDVWSGDVRARGESFAVTMATRYREAAGVLYELANEPGQIGMRDSFDDLISLGRKVKAAAPDTLLGLGAVDGPNDNDTRLCVWPADYVDAHIERLMGVGGFEWVKRSGEYRPIDPEHQPTRMPFISGEPVNFGEWRADGRNGDVERSPSVAFAYGAVSRARQYNGCFHYDGGLWTTLPTVETLACLRAWHDALDAFPMLTDGKWRGGWAPSQGNYWNRDAWPGSDDARDVEDHIARGRGPWRANGCGAFSVCFPEPEGWDYQANLTAPATRIAHCADGAFAASVYRKD
jgi:hypothetical protein